MQKIIDPEVNLISLAQTGDRRAFDMLIHKYQHKIFKIIARYIKDPQESLDLSQEIFFKVYKALGQFKFKSSFYTWVYTISVNTVKNYFRNQNRNLETLSYDLLAQENSSCLNLYNYSGGSSPAYDSELNELEDLLLIAINKLPLILKNTIILREVEGLSYEEIAAISLCPVGTVRSRLFRARKAIEDGSNKQQVKAA